MLRRAPSTARNREPIAAVLGAVAPRAGTVLEIASGLGEHAVFLAPRLAARDPHGSLHWQPSDPSAEARASIAGWIDATPDARSLVAPPIALDVRDPTWPIADGSVAMIVCINMIHIAPWEATTGLFRGASRALNEQGLIYLYGPYKRDGLHTAPSNEAFDADLRARDPSWGVRDLDDVRDVAEAHGFGLRDVVEMPANNLSVVFARR